MGGVHRPLHRLYHSLGLAIARRLRQNGRKVVSVEWGTGGRLAAGLTRPPGASAYYLAGLVLPGPPGDDLEAEEVGRRLGADLAVSLDGLARPPVVEIIDLGAGRRVSAVLTGPEAAASLLRDLGVPPA